MHINMLHFAFIFGGSIQHAYRNRKRIVATIMNETAVLAIVRKVNEEIKEELRIEFSERIAGLLETVRKQQTQINEQQHQIDAVKAFYARLVDPRLTYFSSDEPSSTGSKANLDPVIVQHGRNQKIIALHHGIPCMNRAEGR